MCLNPVISEGRYIFDGTTDGDLQLVHVTQFQRHLDRWLYEHPLIDDVCWTGQLNSSAPSMGAQCDYNLSSVWAQWPRQADPYSAPDSGQCTCPQLTTQGQSHAARLGALLRAHVLATGSAELVRDVAACTAGRLRLEFDDAQKNEMTAEQVYAGVCERLPALAEFPAAQCVVPALPAPRTPFFLNTAVCNTAALQQLTAEAAQALLDDAAFNQRLAVPLANWMRAVTGHASAPPANASTSFTWLDNLIDCSVVHQCLPLDDLPAAFAADGGAALAAADWLETRSRVYAFDYFAERPGDWLLYTSLYYGYYYRVLTDRMLDVIAARPNATFVSVQVMSDGNVSPLLKSLRLDLPAQLRPVWGSTLVFELLQSRSQPSEYFVRVTFNGRVQKLAGACHAVEFCPWNSFFATVSALVPSPAACPIFYRNYH